MNDENFLISPKLFNFKKAINPFSMKFLDSFFEDEFYKYKSLNYKLIQTILLFSFICYFFISIKPLQVYLLYTLDLNYLGVLQDPKSSLIGFIRTFIYLIAEISIYFITKFRIIRGLIISIGFSFEMLYTCYFLNINLKTNTFFCVFFTIPTLLNSVFISLIYCHNWIIGSFFFSVSKFNCNYIYFNFSNFII